MEKFDIPYDQFILTVRHAQKNLFSVSIDNTFSGYIAKKGEAFTLQPSSKLPVEAYDQVVAELRKRLVN